jgi:hypothetical protein
MEMTVIVGASPTMNNVHRLPEPSAALDLFEIWRMTPAKGKSREPIQGRSRARSRETIAYPRDL